MTEKLVATTRDGWTYAPASRWIKIRYADVTKRSVVWDYADHYFASDKVCTVSYFIHKGKKYAIGQFMRLLYPIFYEDKEGKTGVIGGYDGTSYYNPYYIEIHPDGEYVRLWKEVH